MFNKLAAVLFLLLCLTTAFSIRLVDPVNKELVNGDFVGSVSPGATLELIISKDFGKFDSLSLAQELPSGFIISTKNEQESFKVFITVPKTVALTEYTLSFTLNGKNAEETVQVYFSVEKGLLQASFDNYATTAVLGKSAEYKATLVNSSYADEYFTITPQLPWYWKTNDFSKPFVENKVLVPKRSTKTITYAIIPRAQGEKTFNTIIKFGESGESKTSTVKVTTLTSIDGKFESVLFGIPFYSFSLFPSYVITGLLGYFLN